MTPAQSWAALMLLCGIAIDVQYLRYPEVDQRGWMTILHLLLLIVAWLYCGWKFWSEIGGVK